MTYFQSVRAGGVSPIIVDGGDFLFSVGADYKRRGSQKRQSIEKAKLIADAYNQLGYEAAAVAESELVFGLDVLENLRQRLEFPLLCANMVSESTGNRLFEASQVIERNGLKVGVIAVLMQLRDTYMQKVAKGAKILPPLPALEEEMKRLEKDVDVFVILGHVNRPDVEKIASEMGGVDFIIEPNSFTGNDTDWVPEGKRFVENNGNLMLKIDAQGAHVGRLDLEVVEPGRPWAKQGAEVAVGTSVNRYNGYDVELGTNFGYHPGVEGMIQRFKASTRHSPTEEAADFVPSKDYLTIDTCKACHPDQYTFWEKTEHATAYATLEETGDQHRYDCVPCHVLAYGETFVEAGAVGANKNVQCESCHGSNPKHPTDPKKHSWKDVTHKACWGCHNPRITRASFRPSEDIPKIKCPPMTRR